MKQLTANTKVSIAELRDWFGIGLSTWQKNKTDYLILLKEYCDYEIISTRTFLIKEVKSPEFQKFKTKAKKFVQDNYRKYWADIDTAKCVAAKLLVAAAPSGALRKNKNEDYSISTIEGFISEFKNQELAENVIIQDKVWAKIQGAIGKDISVEELAERKYVELTDEEIEYVHKRFNEYFKKIPDAYAEIQQDIKDGKLARDKAWDEFEKKAEATGTQYVRFLEIVSHELQAKNPEVECDWLTRATRLLQNAIKKGDFDF